MKFLIRFLVFFLVVTSTFYDVQAQQSERPKSLTFENESLRNVLNRIEQLYDVKFSYISEIVNGHEISGKFSTAQLEELLKEILNTTNITFQFIDKNNIILNSSNQPTIKKRNDKRNFSLRGRITNSLTKEPVAFASIVVGDSGKGTVSGEDGQFEIGNLTASISKVKVQMVGFKQLEQTVDIESEPVLSLELEEAFVELEGIEITPGLFNIQTAEPKAHSLSAEEITFSPNFARDIYRTLSLVPGVSNTEFSSKARIRGGHSDETAIYLDNFEIYEPFHLEEFDGVFSVINTDFVEKTKVLTGGFSPRYTDKISGIISVETPDNIGQTETKISLDIINASVIRKQKISPKSSAFFWCSKGVC